MDYCDNEWFALKTNTDHSIIFEIASKYSISEPSPVAQMVKHLLTMQETRFQSLGREDLLEKEMATDSSILAWKIT